MGKSISQSIGVTTIEKAFEEVGLIVKKLTTIEELRNHSWVMTTKDKEGMIKLSNKKLCK